MPSVSQQFTNMVMIWNSEVKSNKFKANLQESVGMKFL